MSTLPTPEFLALQDALAGRYSLERELGRGGMGIVYLAQEVRLDRPVALKVLPPDYAARPALRERLLLEARTAARLSHPHIVPIHAVHEIGDFVLFAMAYVDGETLGKRIREKGPLPPRDAARILREVSWALAYAHAQGVVHRDVKPDNILLEAGSGRALVTDFGIAHVSAEVGLTAVGEVLGTPEFMSPEQAGGEAVDAKSDLYSLGVVGHYMLSGRLPFQGATAAATLAKHLTQPAPPLASVAPALPVALTQAVDRCLEKDPAERFADGEELADALTQALEERREVPIALRLFMKQNRESTASMATMEVFPLGMLALAVALFALVDGDWGPPLVPLLVMSAVMLALASTPVAMLVQMARRLLRSGYDHGDLVRAMREEIEERRGELASTYGSERSRLDWWLKRLLSGGLGVHLAGLGWFAFGPYLPGIVEVLVTLMSVAGVTWMGAGVVSAVRYQLRGHVPGQGWLKFWDGLLGRALFKASRMGLEELPVGAPYGPTELAIGIAADRLFEALPTDQRKAFRELPDVVRRLEADAETMRARIKELDALRGEVDDGGPGTSDETAPAAVRIAGRRDSLTEDLKRATAAAEDRLHEVVAALETIRVELLRLHAGAGNIESMTMDLNAARVLSEDIARTLEGRREVERLLGRPAPSTLATTPTPA
ncbi:MAG: serine/threonine-protein kinase [Longimicrobiales bacterium]|nr:serine/threonine-protein kinase [Longimicrobiales bacterium]